MAESAREARFVGLHFSGHEDEAGEPQPEPDDGNVRDGFFEDDVHVPVQAGEVGVGGVPEVDPVVVELPTQTLSEIHPI